MERISPKNKHCFFGYYDKYPTDINDKLHLFHYVDFFNRPPTEKDRAKIVICEIQTGKSEIIDETYTWNFQQGSMLQFLDESRIIYNYRKGNKFLSKIYNIKKEEISFLPGPVSAISSDSKYAISINFSRLAKWRPGYGYEGVRDEFENEKWPEKDGIYIIDIEKKEKKLIIPLSHMLDFRKEKDISTHYSWFNHTLFSPSGKRFIFLNRWEQGENPFKTRLLTSDPEGKEIYDLVDTYRISHFAWKNDKEIIVWAEIKGKFGFWIVEDKTGKIKKVSEKIQKFDGHCSYSKDEKFILYDTYPVENYRYLKLFDGEKEEEKILGKFYSPPEINGEIRCDLHPRWLRSEKFISFDSIHEGFRGVYLFEI